MSEALPIPGWPGYTVGPDCIVRSPYGPLAFDERGRISLREPGSKKYRKLPICDILKVAGLLPSEEPAPAPAVEGAKQGLARLERDLALLELQRLRQWRDLAGQDLDALRQSLAAALHERDAAVQELASLRQQMQLASEPSREAADSLRKQLDELSRQLAEATHAREFNRRLNATLWYRLRRLMADLAQPKLGRPEKNRRAEVELWEWEELGTAQ